MYRAILYWLCCCSVLLSGVSALGSTKLRPRVTGFRAVRFKASGFGAFGFRAFGFGALWDGSEGRLSVGGSQRAGSESSEGKPGRSART